MVDAVSFPPFRTAQFPLLMQRELICTRASGRASKIIPITPIGQVTRTRVRPSSSSRRSVTLPTGSSSPIRPSIPARTSASLCSSKRSRLTTAAEMPVSSAFFRSSRLAAKISSRCADSASCTERRAALRTSDGSDAMAGLASFIFITCSRILMESPPEQRHAGSVYHFRETAIRLFSSDKSFRTGVSGFILRARNAPGTPPAACGIGTPAGR